MRGEPVISGPLLRPSGSLTPSVRERLGEKKAALAQALGVDPVADPSERCHCVGIEAPASASAAMNMASNEIIGS